MSVVSIFPRSSPYYRGAALAFMTLSIAASTGRQAARRGNLPGVAEALRTLDQIHRHGPLPRLREHAATEAARLRLLAWRREVTHG